MKFTREEKDDLKREVVNYLEDEPEVRKIVIFGSFAGDGEFSDIDVAIFQDSTDNYLPLAMKYRKKIRPVAKRFPVDVIPLKMDIR
jgi:predicted nucleotidyltransferase